MVANEEEENGLQRPKGVFHTAEDTEDCVVLGQHPVVEANVHRPGRIVHQNQCVEYPVH